VNFITALLKESFDLFTVFGLDLTGNRIFFIGPSHEIITLAG
jgi:hypothetical protein